jgi:hypothetical protein
MRHCAALYSYQRPASAADLTWVDLCQARDSSRWLTTCYSGWLMILLLAPIGQSSFSYSIAPSKRYPDNAVLAAAMDTQSILIASGTRLSRSLADEPDHTYQSTDTHTVNGKGEMGRGKLLCLKRSSCSTLASKAKGSKAKPAGLWWTKV